MPYIGNTIRAADDYRLIDDISSGFNGSTTSFALQVAGSAPVPFPKSPQQVLISVNGVIQEPDPTGASGFNLVGTNIVFSSAPTNGHAFFGIIYATADYLNAGGNFPAGSLGAPSITFIGDENTGLFRKSGGSVGFVSDATEIANFDSNGITISSGNLIIPESIIHSGDTDTKIRFNSTDQIKLETAGSERVHIDGVEVVFNETGAGTDFRIEGDSDTNLFKIDASTDQVGIGTASIPSGFKLAVNGDLSLGETSGTDNTFIDQKQNGALELINSGVGSNNGGMIRINRFNNVSGGTAAFRDTQIYNGKNSLILNIDGSANSVLPGSDSSVDLGSNSVRFQNGYFDTLYGDGSNLTGVTSTTINNNANNRIITGSGTANTLEGEADLTFDGTDLNLPDNKKIRLGDSQDLQLYHSGSHSFIIDNGTGDLKLRGSEAVKIEDTSSGKPMITCTKNFGTEIYHQMNSALATAEVKFATTSTGVTITGNALPATDNAHDLGSSSKRWQNVYTTDLKLSNEGSQNDVDSTWGNYTIQEGHEDLFLINHRTGKKFKFNLTEVS